MLDATGKKLIELLRSKNSPELRCAAAKVLSEVGSRDGDLGRALCAALRDPEQAVRLEVLATIGQLRIEPALPQLLERVAEGGPEAEAAAQAAARLGAKGTRALQGLMSQVAPGLRRRIAAALGVGGTASASAAAVDALLDTDPGVVDAVTRALTSEIALLPDSQRRALVDHVLRLLKPKKAAHLSTVSEAALIRLLATLHDPRALPVFWERIDPPCPSELRTAALQGLGAHQPPAGRDKFQRLVACATDPDFRVVVPALMLLKLFPASPRTAKDWLPLFDAADVAARRFALEKLSGIDTAELAEALSRQLTHPDRQLRDDASARLGQTETGRAWFAGQLLQAKNPDEAWSVARAQARFASQYRPALRNKLFLQACRYLEAGDRRADAFLYLLREIDPKALRDQLEERGLSLRKKKKYEMALAYLRLLTRDPACAEATRFETAACALRISEHSLAAESRPADPALQQFARLIHSHEVDPAIRVRQAKWLQPEDLFFLGFHFVEGDRQEREFGAEMLRQMMRRSPRSKLAKDAKRKLRSANLD